MAWNKRAQSEDVFWFAFFYFPLTAAVILALIIMPKTLMEQSVQPVPLDEQVQARQINSRLWQTSTVTGRTSPFEYTDDLTGINSTFTKKLMAYSVTIDGKTTTHQKQFQDIAKPIAPFRYMPYTEVRNVEVNGVKKQMIIEEYYPEKYEVNPT